MSRPVSSTIFCTVTERHATSFSTSKISSCFDFSFTMVDTVRKHVRGVGARSHGELTGCLKGREGERVVWCGVVGLAPFSYIPVSYSQLRAPVACAWQATARVNTIPSWLL